MVLEKEFDRSVSRGTKKLIQLFCNSFNLYFTNYRVDRHESCF